MILLVNIDSVISFFGGDFKDENKIIVVDEVNSFEDFKTTYETVNQTTGITSNYVIEKSDESLEDLKNEIKEEKLNNIIVKISESDDNYMSAEIYTYDPINDTDFQIISAVINTIKSSYALENSGIDPEVLAGINAPVEVSRQNLNPDIDEDASSKMLLGNVISMVFVIPFFIFIMLLVQMLGAEINDEKTTKSMEIIISNVSPRTHFISKISGAILFVLIQLVLMIAYIVAGVLLRVLLTGGLSIADTNGAGTVLTEVVELFKTSGILAMLPYAIPLILVLLVVSLLAYAIFAGVLASVTTNTEDFQQVQTPIMIVCMAGYFLAFMATAFEGSMFIKIIDRKSVV
jgi:ABC-2 type transport system permease protein